MLSEYHRFRIETIEDALYTNTEEMFFPREVPDEEIKKVVEKAREK